MNLWKVEDLAMLLLICLVFLLCISSIACESYTPLDRFFINCGGSNSVELDDGRIFEPDSRVSDVGLPHSSQTVFTSSVSGYSALYNTARVFNQSSMYTFKTKKTGRHWLRLHFHPFENSKFDLKSAVFSFVANGFTLLHGFSFSALKQGSPLVKEYVVDLRSSSFKTLELKFSPQHNSIAFINGIEVISVSDGEFPFRVMPIPLGPELEIPRLTAFETVYRINMGSLLKTSKNDSYWRTWEPDYPYLVNTASTSNVSVNPSRIKYTDGVSVNVAPNWVYATAQQMADAHVSDQRFNISWIFKVVPSFTYFVRMHFCDIVSVATDTLVFDVYLNNQSAITAFDISSTKMEISAAYFVDFVTNVSSSSNQILVQVGPSNLRNLPTNAILNGLEIFKMSNLKDSLQGSIYSSNIVLKAEKKKSWTNLMAISSFSTAFAVLLVVSAALVILHLRREKKQKHQPLPWLPIPINVGNSSSKISFGSFASTSHTHNSNRVLSFSEICEATKNFDKSLLMAVGGFGKVYKGILENGTVVAVKRGNPESQQGLTEFRTEIAMLSKLRHRHLVSLIGFCEEQNEMILVYEYMAGGPLRKHLYGSKLRPLTWKQRLEICIGAAKGLHYLHTGADISIIHRDVKTTNILLDENLKAKVSDFGLSKLGPTLDQTHVSTAVKGSFGYLDPEYFRRQQLTEKSDVYSFGVVLMEVLCARPAINAALPREQVNVAEWAMHWQKRGLLEKIVDKNLAGTVSFDSLRKFGETAEKCLAEHGIDRPAMGDVLWNLEYALQLQEASLQNASSNENSAKYIPEIPGFITRIEYLDGNDIGDVIVDHDLDTCTSSGVFSQILNPKGR